MNAKGARVALPKACHENCPRRKSPSRLGIAFWVEGGDGRILLRRRPQKGLLGGMVEVPSTPWEAKLPRKVASPFHGKMVQA